MNRKQFRILCCALLSGIILAVPLYLSKASSFEDIQPRISIYEEYSYQCSYNLTTGYSEELQFHRLMLVAEELAPEIPHNLTLITDKTNVRAINLYGEGEGHCENTSIAGKEYITALFNGSRCDLFVWFDEAENCANPFDLLVVPYDTNVFSSDTNGNLFFDVWLNTSCCLGNIFLEIRSASWDSPLIANFTLSTDLSYNILSYRRYAEIELIDVPKGDHLIRFRVQVNSLNGDFIVNGRATQKDANTVQTDCILDGQNVFPSRFLTFDYSTTDFTFIQSVSPWLYAYSEAESYCLNYTAPRKCVLRIDLDSREQIDFLIINSPIKNISIVECEYYDSPCYEIDLELEEDSSIMLGLTLYNKIWLLRPTTMQLSDIPLTIKETFTHPSSSIDGQFIDVNNPSVQSLAKQVIQNESNPYLIAYLLYQNLTSNKQYNETFPSEYASATLQYHQGVCRHFARAYAALCMSADLPVRTVIGTAFSFLNETWKKNHEWDEVYFPRYGWVTVDPTWDEFGVLSNKHAFATYWNYVEKTLNVTKPSSDLLASAKIQSQSTLKRLIDSVQTKTGHNTVGNFETLLNQAEAAGENGYIHEALLKLAEAYTSGAQEASCSLIVVFQTVSIMLLVVTSVLAFYVVRLRRKVARMSKGT